MMSTTRWKNALGFLTLCILATTSAFADYYDKERCPDFCAPCRFDCCGIEIGADFLYWQSCLNDLDYAILNNFDLGTNSVINRETYQYLEHDYEPGFRVRAYKHNIWCGWDLSGSYTFYWSQASNRVSPVGNQNLHSTLNHGGFNLTLDSTTLIEASHSIRYQSFDVLFHYPVDFSGLCHGFIPFWGVEGVKLDQNTVSLTDGEFGGSSATYSVNWDSELLGLGIKLGTDYNYRLMCGLEWFTRASVTILAGRNDSTNTQVRAAGPTPTIFQLGFETCDTICVPGFHLQAGLAYEKEWCGWMMRGRIGYEFLDWWNVPRVRRFFDDGENIGLSTGSNGSNLGLHGLLVGLDIGY